MTVPVPPDRPEPEPAATPEDASTPTRPATEPGRPDTAHAPASATESKPGSESDSGPESNSDPEPEPDSNSGDASTPTRPDAAHAPVPATESKPESGDASTSEANSWTAPPSVPLPASGPAPATNPWAVPNPNAAPPIHPAMSGPVPGPFPGAVPPHVPPHIPSPNGTYWGQYPAPVPQPRNGLGVAALVLGIISLVLCLPLILFWFAWLPAVLAVVFGCIGLSLARKRQATNRPMALTGTVLGAVALLASIVTGGLLVADLASSNAGPSVTVGMHDDSEEQRLADEQAKEDAAKEADEKARHLSFGGSYTYSDGLKVTMAEPAATTPVKSPGSPLPQDATFVRLQVTVVNTSSAELSLYGSGLLIVKDSNDTLLYPLFGSGQYQGLPKSLAPGQEATAVETYGLPNASSDPFTLRFTHGTDLRDVTWIGSPPR